MLVYFLSCALNILSYGRVNLIPNNYINCNLMLKEANILLDSNCYSSYGYHFVNTPDSPLFQIKALGLEKQSSCAYYWDGLKRPQDDGHIIFQYTLSGLGFMRLGETIHQLIKGTAFIIDIPSNHSYYLPKESKEWEFIYIHLYGKSILELYENIVKQKSNIILLSPSSQVIKYLWTLLTMAKSKNITDGFQTSGMAYQFMMELGRSDNIDILNSKEKFGSNIESAINFMLLNYSKELSLEDLSIISGLSKFHFSRTFARITGITPWNYLTKIRLEKSIELMQTENYDFNKISTLVGFSGANYFNKVFKKYLGTSPGKFREQHFSYQNYHIKI